MFRWNISEVCDEQTLGQASGEIELGGVKKVAGLSWQVHSSDVTERLVVQSGGIVEAVRTPVKKTGNLASDDKATVNLSDTKHTFIQIVILILVALFGIGFLAVVIAGVINRELDFKTYMAVVAAFLSGFGARTLKEGHKNKKN